MRGKYKLISDDEFYFTAIPHYWDAYCFEATFWKCKSSVKAFKGWLTAWDIQVPKKYLDKYLTKEVRAIKSQSEQT